MKVIFTKYLIYNIFLYQTKYEKKSRGGLNLLYVYVNKYKLIIPIAKYDKNDKLLRKKMENKNVLKKGLDKVESLYSETNVK